MRLVLPQSVGNTHFDPRNMMVRHHGHSIRADNTSEFCCGTHVHAEDVRYDLYVQWSGDGQPQLCIRFTARVRHSALISARVLGRYRLNSQDWT